MDMVLSLVVLAAFGLLLGAFFLWRRGGERKQVLLMILLAIIAMINVAIWTIPDAGGTAPVDRIDHLEDRANQPPP